MVSGSNFLTDKTSEDKIEKMENENCILYPDGTLIHKKEELKKLSAFAWVLIFLFLIGILNSWIEFFNELKSLNSEYFEYNKWGFAICVTGFSLLIELIVLRTLFKKRNNLNETSRTPFIIGIHAFLFTFLFLFSFTFFLASMPAATPVSMCYALRPWWCWFNILFAFFPALFMGLVIYFASKKSFE